MDAVIIYISLEEYSNVHPSLLQPRMLKWTSGHPNTSIGQCIAILNGSLLSADCERRRAFICERYLLTKWCMKFFAQTLIFF